MMRAGVLLRVPLKVREALNSALDEELARDPSVFIIGEEVDKFNGAYKVTDSLGGKYRGRVIDTPISEMGFTGLAIGAAMANLRPVVEFMSMNFSMQAMDQIINGAAKARYMSGGLLHCPIVFRGLDGASAGAAAQHSQTMAHVYASIPGLKVFSVYNTEDARGMIKSAIRDDNPVMVVESEVLYGELFDTPDSVMGKDFLIPFGKAKIEVEGEHISIFAHGHAVGTAIAAAKALLDRGIRAEVVNLRSLRPLDTKTIQESVAKTHRAMTVEEAFAVCGIGAEVVSIIAENDSFYALDAPVERVSFFDVPMPYALNLETATIPQVNDVIEVATRIVARSLPKKK